MADCLFCGIVEGSIPSQTVDSDERTVAFMDINPATPGHALVVPRAHSEDLMAIEPEDLEAASVAARRLAARMDEVLKPDGFNILNCCRPRRLADRLPLPLARDPALRGRPAEAAVDPPRRPRGRDRRDRGEAET